MTGNLLAQEVVSQAQGHEASRRCQGCGEPFRARTGEPDPREVQVPQ
eukprot:CAMPEP_0168690214 /NCGR_PEP_ID=MMETSP0503-20121227/32028_1 /TAXON_ID=89963 /ORGANISM="Heterocapsa rotundata, Strain SCCAP K-0483" /LENGTH=46 /DNA_ID= /DNA_START= /DNA_END= /DNA_ORIENTATION=